MSGVKHLPLVRMSLRATIRSSDTLRRSAGRLLPGDRSQTPCASRRDPEWGLRKEQPRSRMRSASGLSERDGFNSGIHFNAFGSTS